MAARSALRSPRRIPEPDAAISEPFPKPGLTVWKFSPAPKDGFGRTHGFRSGRIP